jgi:FkbM family methyltransferase
MKRLGKLVRCLVEPTYRRALSAHRVAAGVEHGPVLRSIGDCRMVVDIGANRGQFSLVARKSLPMARIVSFEPLPVPAATFRAAFADDARVMLHQVAIGPERGEVTIHLSQRDDSSSLLPITAMQNALFPGTSEAGTTLVAVGPLLDYLPLEDIAPPALLKLDVQGFELQALQGCEEALKHFAHVYVECSFVELYAGQALADLVIAWLREHDFVLRGVYNMSHDVAGKAIQADFLFSR